MSVYTTSTSKANVCFVALPDDATIQYVSNVKPTNALVFKVGEHDRVRYLPSGHDWQLIAPLSEVTEEQAAQIVDRHYFYTRSKYKDYLEIYGSHVNAIISLKSLARSLNPPEGQNVVVLAEFKQ